MSARYAALVLDADSTLSGIEGIDWLAARRGPELGARIEAMTHAAMAGGVPLEQVYGERIALIAPSAVEVAQLSGVYQAAVAPDTGLALARLRAAGVRLVIVSGGVREALLPMAAEFGIAPDDVHAVSVRFDADGRYAGWEQESPLATQRGKPQVVQRLALPHPLLAVGDGSTDLAIRSSGVADAFACFTGFVRREHVVKHADYDVTSWTALADLVLP